MSGLKRLLILGGTGEAAALAAQAVAGFSNRLEVITSLAGRVKPERELPGQVRVGGFGGGNGLADFIKSQKIDLLIDATHPFAATISANAHDACLTCMTPRLRLERPPWNVPGGAKLLYAADMTEAADIISRLAQSVLVTTGQKNLDAFADCRDIHFVIRVIEAPSNPPPIRNHKFISGRPPHRLEDERALMSAYNIDCLLAKDSGGNATMAKITAAIERDALIILLERPLPEPGERVDSVEGAISWLEKRT